MILFSAKVSDKHRTKLKNEYPNEHFIFCENPEEAKSFRNEAEVYVTFGSEIDEAFIQEAKNLKWLACLSAGVDGFPFQAIKEKGIILTNVKGIHKTQMAEYAIAMLLQVYRNSKPLIENEKNAIWDKRTRVKEITGKTILIFGTGAIGSETARLAKAFRMETLGISRSGRNKEHFDSVYKVEDMIDILPKADLIVSVLPATGETKHLFTYQEFQAMKSSVVFLNMGRGSVLVEDDLLRAIHEGEISHAVLDVFEKEPLVKEHPFWKEENITVTPHISGLSPAYVQRALEIFRENLNIHRSGEGDFINVVDLTNGY